MKKVIAVFFAVLMLFSSLALLSACGGEKITVEEGPLGKYSPNLTVSYARPYFATDESILAKAGWTLTENGWFDLIKEHLGVKIRVEWSLNDYGMYVERLNNAILEGTIPDILDVSAGEGAYQSIQALYNNDIIAELDDVMANYMSDDARALYELAGPEIFYPATFNGKTYAICQVASGEGIAKTFYYIRQDWLDNLNLQAPTNYTELEEVIEAFANKDPDGDGEKNTFGMTVNTVQSSELDAYFNGYGAYPNIWLENDQGELYYGTVGAEMKKPLERLSHMIKSGWVDYAPLSGANISGDFMTGKTGIVIGQTNSILTLTNLYRINPDAKITAIPAFTEDGDVAKVTAGPNSYRYYVASKEFDYPEVLIKLNNFMLYMTDLASSDIDLYHQYFTVEDGSAHLYNYAPVVQEDYPARNYNNAVLVGEALASDNRDMLETELQRMLYDWVKEFEESGRESYRGYALLYGENGIQQLQGLFFENDGYIQNKFLSVPTATMASHQVELDTLEIGAIGQILVGEQPLDYFDIFIGEWKDLGGSDVTREVNEWYQNING